MEPVWYCLAFVTSAAVVFRYVNADAGAISFAAVLVLDGAWICVGAYAYARDVALMRAARRATWRRFGGDHGI